MSASEMFEPLAESNKHISVVTVCHNAQRTIEATLQSVARQEHVGGFVEHIVVDGASGDDTLTIVKQFPDIKWISEPDAGISDAFNKGLHLASGEYILYLNADDHLYDSNVLNDVLKFIDANQHPDWIVGDIAVSLNSDVKIEQSRYPPSCWSLMFRDRIGHPAVFLKRRALLDVGGFDVRFELAMDYDLWQRLCFQGYRPVHFRRIISVFSREGLSSSKSPKLLQERQEVERRFRDNPLKRLVGGAYDRVKGRS